MINGAGKTNRETETKSQTAKEVKTYRDPREFKYPESTTAEKSNTTGKRKSIYIGEKRRLKRKLIQMKQNLNKWKKIVPRSWWKV